MRVGSPSGPSAFLVLILVALVACAPAHAGPPVVTGTVVAKDFHPAHTVEDGCAMSSNGVCLLHFTHRVPDDWTVTLQRCDGGCVEDTWDIPHDLWGDIIVGHTWTVPKAYQ